MGLHDLGWRQLTQSQIYYIEITLLQCMQSFCRMDMWCRMLCLTVILATVICSGDSCTQTRRVARTVRYTVRCGLWGWGRCTRYKKVYSTRTSCCVGYNRQGSTCVPRTTTTTTTTTTPAPFTGTGFADNTTTRCGWSYSPNKMIVGGQDATKYDQPWIASLTYYGDHFCGGSLINNQFILTAAHCVEFWETYMYNSLLTVKLGEFDRSVDEAQEITLRVINHIMHAGYDDESLRHDIALIKLTEEVQMTNFISPICLPSSSSDLLNTGDQTTIAGWGVTRAGPRSEGHPAAVVLQESQLYVTSDRVCDNTYTGYTPSRQICATDGEGDVERAGCFGDSGGPMTAQDVGTGLHVLHGITSYGPARGCAKGIVTVYTEVAYYLDWIEQTMNNM